MSSIKVSVIMPVYNSEKYLQQALESISAQTLKEFELICVDDGSTDSSYDILNNYAKHELRMSVLRHLEYTDGAAEARNMGMRAAKGEYLAFVDSDDYFSPLMLEHAYRKAKQLDVDILMFDAWYVDNNEGIIYEDSSPLNWNFLPAKEVFTPESNLSRIFRMTHGASWGRLFRKEFIVAKGITFFSCRFWDDIVFVYTAICEAEKIGVLREKLLYYRHNHEMSQTRDKGYHAEIGIKAPLELKRQFEIRGLYNKYRIPLINCILSRSISMLISMKTDGLFTEMFHKLKNRYLREFGAFDIDDNEYYEISIRCCRDAIMKASSPLSFWLLRENLLESVCTSNILHKIASYVNGECRIALYGAGMNGKKAFMRIMSSTCYSVCAWVDMNYNKIGFPVSSPESLRAQKYDYILIAIEDERIVNEVKKYLFSIGVESKKIIWIPEIASCN